MKTPRKSLRRFALAVTLPLALGPQNSTAASASRRSQHPAKKPLLTPDGFDKAMSSGDIDFVRRALEGGLSPNIRFEDPNASTPLIVAARDGDSYLIRLMLAHGANVNARTKTGHWGRTGLWELANSEYNSINLGLNTVTPAVQKARDTAGAAYAKSIRQMVASGANANIADYNGVTPIGLAAYRGSLMLVKALLDGGANPNIRDNFGKTPIEWAAYNGHAHVVKLLRSRGARVNKRGLPGPGQRMLDESLYNAVKAHDIPRIKSLLARGANADCCVRTSTYDDGWILDGLTTPLLTCAASPLVTNLLISYGANVNRRNDKGVTPLMEAASGGEPEVMKILLKHGARLYTRDHEGKTALMQSYKHSNLHVLLAHGAARHGRINDRDRFGITALKATDSEAMLATLLRLGANINARDNKGRTALMEAVDGQWGEAGVAACYAVWARVLLKHGANPNVRDNNGNTALMLLALQGQYSIYNRGDPVLVARLLLQHGAKLSLRNRKGQTARRIAAARHARSLLRVIQAAQGG